MFRRSRAELGQSRRWVVKIGSAMVTADGQGLDRAALDQWAAQLAALHGEGRDVVIVSSGAIAEGMQRLGWSSRPKTLHELQAAAAVGQMGLVQAYESAFQRHGIATAQILVTHEDAADRQRYLNIRNTLRALLKLRVIPVVNENDTVAFDEIRFGDNDSLGAVVVNLIEADLYVILTDQSGLYSADPRRDADAVFIDEAAADDPQLLAMASPQGGRLGRGGMATKITAAAKAARSGAFTVLAHGREPQLLQRLAAGEALGTVLRPSRSPAAARKQWLSGQLQVRGHLWIDAGAVIALRQRGSSLLPVGVTRVIGDFGRGELVAICGPDGGEVARGLVNYAAEESRQLQGKASAIWDEDAEFIDADELVHRDNLVLV